MRVADCFSQDLDGSLGDDDKKDDGDVVDVVDGVDGEPCQVWISEY